MDMDFFNDQILTDLDRADYVGGIDNEAIFFEDLHVNTGVGRLGPNSVSSPNSSSNGAGPVASLAKADTPVTSPTSVAPLGGDIVVLPPIPSVSARVSLTSTPHIGIHTNHHHNNSGSVPNHTHLPESPPDSGSEPPYSPLQDVQGLTMAVRDMFQHGSGGNSDMSLLAQPHEQNHHYSNLMEAQTLNLNNLTSPGQNHNMAAQGIRVKHEAGLIINPNSLNSSGLLHQQQQQQHSADTHIDMAGPHHTANAIYNHNNNGNPPHSHLNYDSLAQKLYGSSGAGNGSILGSPPALPPPSYALSMGHMDQQHPPLDTPCMLTPIGDLPHVQVVGTSLPSTPQLQRASAPSTPNHQSSSRKRKMTTQIDCPDFACVKPDPGLVLSPSSRNSICGTPLPGDLAKRCATSPLNIQLSGHDIADTPAHSTASLSPALSTANLDGSNCSSSAHKSSGGGDTGSTGTPDALSPCIHFTPFQPQSWHELADQNLQEVKVSFYRVDADKGFNFSVSDDAFVCQKKNHFQITCHARLQSEAKFVKTPSGLEKIKSFHLHFYGVKLEAPNQTIRIEQSQSDRSKKPFYPVPIDLQSHIVSKVTVGRLHFSETTNNNMRKKGRPNPEQRYFQLVVGLHVHTASGDFPIVAQGSDKIIVRASNPGQFESDVDLCWQRGITQDSIFHAGRVGINTDRPDESLVVHGNLKISGHIVQPSDSRAKQEIGELDTSVQLRNLQKIRIVRYRLEPEFALHSGLKCTKDEPDIVDTGVIAQEVREVIPDAVQEAGSVVLPNGSVIENFLLVNKDRILMENIGAVKELCKVTGTLETRIENLERVNHHLQRVKENDLQFMHCKNLSASRRSQGAQQQDGYEICSNRTLQIIIFLLVIVMAACLAAVSTLYFVEHNKKQHNFKHLESIQLLSGGHEDLTEQERNFLQLHNLMKTNRTHSLWPGLTYHSSSSSSAGAGARFPSLNGSLLHVGDAGLAAGGGGSELSYFETQEDLALPPSSHQQAGRNDEITVVMEKPSISHELLQPYRDHHRTTPTTASTTTTTTTTTTPASRTNKTVNSKHKPKWPQPQMVLRVMQSASHRNALPSSRSLNAEDAAANAENHVGPHNASSSSHHTSTERIADVIAVQQDFENNSIDTDSQQLVNRHRAASSAKKRPAASISSSAAAASSSSSSSSSSASSGEGHGHSEIQKLSADTSAVSTASSISEEGLRELSPPTLSATGLRHANAKGVELILYKTVAPPVLAGSTSITSTSTSTTSTSTSTSTTASTAQLHSATNHKLNTDAPPHSNYSLETQPITNKSRNLVERNPDNSDNDLQSLTSNNNESIFNPNDPVDYDLGLENRQLLLGRRAAAAGVNGNGQSGSGHNSWVQMSTVYVETFAEPEQCNNKLKREDISNCQSVCFEENNQLLAPIQTPLSLKPVETKKSPALQPEEIDNENRSESEDNDAILHESDDDLQATYAIGAGQKTKDQQNSSLLPLAKALLHGAPSHGQPLEEEHNAQQHQEELQLQAPQQTPGRLGETESLAFDPALEHTFSDETIDVDVQLKKSSQPPGDSNAGDIAGQPNLSVEPNRPPSDNDCWKIRSCIWAERVNNTFAFDEYCPKVGRSINLTYVIPLSRFFKEQSVELHLTSSLPLQWILCNIHEQSKSHGKHLINASHSPLPSLNGGQQMQNVLQRRRNTSLLLLNIPSRGYFVKDLILRATSDPEKTNVCQEMPHDTNTILQYNFRILRDCD